MNHTSYQALYLWEKHISQYQVPKSPPDGIIGLMSRHQRDVVV